VKPMKLVLFFTPAGRLPASWRRPNSRVEELHTLPLAVDIARRAEEARFDALFLADVFYGEPGRNPPTTGYEPFTLMAALSAVTSRIGLIGTASTTFQPPFQLARQLASIDHLSGGRAGWNIVTSSAGGELFGRELPPKAERYRAAEEYLELVTAIWDAYADDAVVADREAGVWAREDGMRTVDFAGEFHRFRGRLKAQRSPQGRPVFVQAGQSADGLEFAARHAEVVFTAQTHLEQAAEFRTRLRERAAAHGRDPDSISVLPGIAPIVAATDEEAAAVSAELQSLVDMDAGVAALQETLQGADLSGIGLDEPIPADRLPDPAAVARSAGLGASRYTNYHTMAVLERMTVRELVFESERGLGHATVTGSVERVADRFEQWYTAGACDGFAITPVYLPEGLDAVCDELVPELRKRGLVPAEYAGTTLREHLGLARPAVVGSP
jgi:FMN-dependent oxidoreductase (nitrilotriacetate monooxygenase family)